VVVVVDVAGVVVPVVVVPGVTVVVDEPVSGVLVVVVVAGESDAVSLLHPARRKRAMTETAIPLIVFIFVSLSNTRI